IQGKRITRKNSRISHGIEHKPKARTHARNRLPAHMHAHTFAGIDDDDDDDITMEMARE
ncbi:hypothetical protein DENSPDRAFT_842831, partial [Dentipellis sp. KUC8613]